MTTENDLTTDIEKRLQLAYKAYDEAMDKDDFNVAVAQAFSREIDDCKCALAALYARAIRTAE